MGTCRIKLFCMLKRSETGRRIIPFAHCEQTVYSQYKKNQVYEVTWVGFITAIRRIYHIDIFELVSVKILIKKKINIICEEYASEFDVISYINKNM